MAEDKYTEKWFNKRLEQHQQAKRPVGGIYYWVFAKVDNKIVCCGFKPSEDEANRYAYENNLVDFQVFPSKSRDVNKVVREAKGKVLNDTHDISEAMQRMKRKL